MLLLKGETSGNGWESMVMGGKPMVTGKKLMVTGGKQWIWMVNIGNE